MSRFVVALLVAGVLALAAGEGSVVLTPDNFDKLVLQSSEPWLVEFFAPWCGHCKSLAPEWAKAAKAVDGIVHMGAVDMDAFPALGQPYNIKGFPTIKVFGANKKAPTDFQGQRTAAALVDGALQAAKDVASARLGGKSSSGGSNGGSNKKASSDAVVELTESNFNSLVLEAKGVVMVEFFAPWCGHCKNLAPEWAKAAEALKGKVVFGAVDATVHGSLGQKYGIQGYPTIKVFVNGQLEEYNGGRSASDLISFAESKFDEVAEPTEVKQLVDAAVFDGECLKKMICFVAVVADIRDANAKTRAAHIAALQGAAGRSKYGWIWLVAGEQPLLEKALDIGGFGYPALAALNGKKKQFALFKGAFTEEGIAGFVKSLVARKVATGPVIGGELPAIATVAAWDGTDNVPAGAVVDEIDLKDLDDEL